MTIWPEVFTNPDFEYGPDDKMQAVADGLAGWACCALGKPPENFGQGMVRVGEATGVGALEKNLRPLADQFKLDHAQEIVDNAKGGTSNGSGA